MLAAIGSTFICVEIVIYKHKRASSPIINTGGDKYSNRAKLFASGAIQTPEERYEKLLNVLNQGPVEPSPLVSVS